VAFPFMDAMNRY